LLQKNEKSGELTVFSPPRPRHLALAPNSGLVKVTRSTRSLVNNGWRLLQRKHTDIHKQAKQLSTNIKRSITTIYKYIVSDVNKNKIRQTQRAQEKRIETIETRPAIPDLNNTIKLIT